LLFCSVAIIISLLARFLKRDSLPFFIASASFFVFSFSPLFEHFVLGQSNIIILFLIALSLYLYIHKKDVFAGSILGLAIIMKPHLTLLLLFFLWKRNYRVLVSTVFLIIFLEGVSFTVYGKDLTLHYWSSMLEYLLKGSIERVSFQNLSFWVLTKRFFDVIRFPQRIVWALVTNCVISFSFFVFTFFITKGKPKEESPVLLLEFSCFLLFAVITFPILHEPHLVLLYLPLLSVWAYLNVFPAVFTGFFFMVCFLLLGLRYSVIRFACFNSGWMSVFAYGKLFGVTLLYMLVCYTILLIKTDGKPNG
jgi:hypothetical protein